MLYCSKKPILRKKEDMLNAPIHPGADLFITLFIIAISVVAGVLLLDVLRSTQSEKSGQEKEKGVLPSSEEEL
jgi:hypothetical protein